MGAMWIRSRKRLGVACRAAAVAALVPGCTTFDSVQEACPSRDVPGSAALDAAELSAINAMDCYRRLSGLGRARITSSVQDAVNAHADYILANPDAERLFAGPRRYLRQSEGEEPFTGETVIERLDAAGYTFADPDAVSTREYLFVAVDGYVPLTGEDGAFLSGGPAMDGLMREHEWRELALQRSWTDGGYTEIELDADWWTASGLCELDPSLCSGNKVPASFTGRMYYMVVVHTDPPIERSFSPFSFPKADQVEVPRYSMSLGEPDPVTQEQPDVQISYPISVFGNAGDPTTANLDAQNIYGLQVRASITDSRGNAYETRVVHPGDPATGVFPDGLELRRSAVIYANQPFQPLTRYRLTAEVTTNESIYDLQLEFTTRSDDPGVGAVASPGAGARVLRGGLTYGPDALTSRLADRPRLTP